jgi:sugar lactone lactonase YvrE
VKPAGLPAPESFIPRSFTLDVRDNIYVLDVFAERVLVLDPAGKFLREIKFPVTYGFFSDLTVDSGGTVFLLDTVQCMVYSASPQAKAFTELTGKLKEYMLFPTNIALDNAGIMYITDQNSGSIVILNPSGGVMAKQLSMGWKEGWLRYPSQVCTTEAGELFVTDRENNRIQVFNIVK